MHCVPSPPSPAWCPGGQTPARLGTIKASACQAKGRGAVRTSRGAGMRTGEGGSAPPEAQGPRTRPAAAAAITRPRGGGACRAPPRAGPPCARSPPPARPRPQLPPDTHALSTSSRTFHMFSIAPRAARPAAACRRTPRTPGRLRAGAGPGPGRRRHPPPRTLPRWSSFSRPQPRRLR